MAAFSSTICATTACPCSGGAASPRGRGPSADFHMPVSWSQGEEGAGSTEIHDPHGATAGTQANGLGRLLRGRAIACGRDREAGQCLNDFESSTPTAPRPDRWTSPARCQQPLRTGTEAGRTAPIRSEKPPRRIVGGDRVFPRRRYDGPRRAPVEPSRWHLAVSMVSLMPSGATLLSSPGILAKTARVPSRRCHRRNPK